MTFSVVCSVYTGSRGLHNINKGNAKFNQRSVQRVLSLKISARLLADWSNVIFHIHDDYC